MEIIINTPGLFIHVQEAVVLIQYCIDGIINISNTQTNMFNIIHKNILSPFIRTFIFYNDHCNITSLNQSYYEYGKLLYDGDWNEGKKDGNVKAYYENGIIRYEGLW